MITILKRKKTATESKTTCYDYDDLSFSLSLIQLFCTRECLLFCFPFQIDIQLHLHLLQYNFEQLDDSFFGIVWSILKRLKQWTCNRKLCILKLWVEIYQERESDIVCLYVFERKRENTTAISKWHRSLSNCI